MRYIITIVITAALAGCFSSGDGAPTPDAYIESCPELDEAGVQKDPAPWCGECVDVRGEVWRVPCEA
jgi:hypothetical protein